MKTEICFLANTQELVDKIEKVSNTRYFHKIIQVVRTSGFVDMCANYIIIYE